eukprot:gene17324-17517_t
MRIAIVGGGPGGLFSAWHLGAKVGDACDITIFEASERIGGKIITGQFAGVGPYEAGVAEIYDYSRRGPDPLHDLIVHDLGLEVKYIDGGPCVLDGKIILTPDDLAEHFGQTTADDAKAFRARCAAMLAPNEFYQSVAEADNAHPWSKISGEALLSTEIKDEAARRYVRFMAHSDVAAPPHHTSGLNFLKNVLMDVDGYMDIFSVIGGNDRIVEGLENEIDAEIRLNSQVHAVEPLPDGTYRLEVDVNGVRETGIFDFVMLAMPLTALSIIHWRSEHLQNAMNKHISYFDRPGHYLRATLLFKRPFWREILPKDWWMMDAFDGCCVYDESARNDFGGWGALAFLIAGNAALSLANVSDERIEQLCLDALPPELSQAYDLVVDRRIHRWMASVNAIPGGLPVRPRSQNHQPDPKNLPGIIMVGDYMFDATLNGVLDSADTGTDIILSELLKRRQADHNAAQGAIAAEHWKPGTSTEAALEHYFSADLMRDMLTLGWDLPRNAKILHLGSASGQMVAALRALGYDATGLEFNRLAQLASGEDVEDHNQLGDFTALPFADQSFDIVIETGLCRLKSQQLAQAIEEIRRVARRGFLLGSVSSDLAIDLLDHYNLLDEVQTLGSRWDWSEKLHAAGFVHSLLGSPRLDDIWKRAVEAGAGPGHWYEDAESLLYCFYSPAAAYVPLAQDSTNPAASPAQVEALRNSRPEVA